jgi:NAD-dependent deacetylase
MSIQISSADRLFVLTGAGISAESGIPTFRGENGLWEGHRIEDVATPLAFARDPELVWRFYSMRRSVALSCKPNPGHRTLAKLEDKLGKRIFVCTQNVDGLHEAAGSVRVFHMHGQLFQSRCSNPACTSPPFTDTKTYPQRSEIPSCRCGAFIRPHIVWFYEKPLHMRPVFRALEECTMFLTVGSSGMVQPAASFPLMAKQNGARTLYVGPESPENALAFDEILLGPAGEQLPKLFA